MSKFVTYPAVTVLDNDHSLLIDSPNAGTNSITANNAANTLLSKWSGFDTFDEAVQNTIEHNQEFIDRDAAIRSETADLKRKIVTTFPAKDASGQIATFDSEFKDAPLKSCIVQIDPVQDLHGYDNPWPAGGGKNLFQTTAVTTTVDGVTFTVNSDGSIKTTGTPTRAISTFVFGRQTLPSGEYIANGFANGANSETRMVFFNENTGAVVAIIYKGNDVTFTLTEESVIRVYPIILTDSYESGWTFYPMIRKATEADATFAPYSNECPISWWTGVAVQRTGKNLFPYQSIAVYTWDFSQKYALSDAVNPIFLKANTTYTMTIDSGNKLYRMRFWDAYGTLIRGYDNAPTIISGESMRLQYYGVYEFYAYGILIKATNVCTITPVVDTWMDMVLQSGASSKNQLELGSTATDYEPYQGETYPIIFPSEAGIIYGAYVDVINGELVVDRAMVVLGSLNFRKDGDREIQRYYTNELSTLIKKPSKTSELANIITSCFRVIAQSESWSQDGTVSVTTGGSIYFMTSAYSTVSDFKTAMSGVQLCYELAEPIHYHLTPTEIKTLLGTNNVWANTGYVSVEYLMSDVGWYVEKKLRAFQSILAGVEDSAVASKNYSTDSYLIFNNDIYRVTKTITAGETIEDGVNVTKTTVAEQLMALAQV